MRTRIPCLAAAFLMGVLLFDLWFAGFLTAPLGLFLASRMENYRKRKEERDYLVQYLDFLNVFSMTSSVGRGGLDAFQYCLEELRLIHPAEQGFMADLEDVIAKTTMDQDIYQLFRDHTFRVPREEIDVFAQMLYLASKKGGDLDRVVAYCSSLLEERVRLQKDKEVLMARQKFELDVIVALPFVLLAIMKGSSPDYMATLVSTPLGWVAVVLALALMGVSLGWGVQLCSFKGNY